MRGQKGVQSKLKLIKSRLRSRLKNDLLNSLLQISINGPNLFSKESDDVITRAVKLWMKTKKRKKVAYKTSRKGAVTVQAMNVVATNINTQGQADVGTQTQEDGLELLVAQQRLEKEQEDEAAKIFGLCEEVENEWNCDQEQDEMMIIDDDYDDDEMMIIDDDDDVLETMTTCLSDFRNDVL